MSLDNSFVATARNAMFNGTFAKADFDAGKLKIYACATAGDIPASADAALGSPTLCSTLTLNATGFGAMSAGVATANAITSDPSAAASTPATYVMFYRIFKSDATTVICQGRVGVSGDTTYSLVLAAAAIVAGAVVSCSALTITLPG